MLTVVSLFSGIEGFGLGLERTGGFRVVAQVEQDPFCLAVLEQHWPEVPRFTDVREVGAHNLPRADVVTGGFPCQDISYAGAGAGLAGERSGLWSEMLRIVGELRPRYVIVENVSALLARGVDVVLGGLATCGYDAEWDCIPASAVGAPHRRDRIWLVAYPAHIGHERPRPSRNGRAGSQNGGSGVGAAGLADARCERSESGRGSGDVVCASGDAEGEGLQRQRRRRAAGDSRPGRSRMADVADATQPGLEGTGLRGRSSDSRAELADAQGDGCGQERSQRRSLRHGEHGSDEPAQPVDGPRGFGAGTSPWSAEPDVGRVADGVPARVDRLRALGNALVPQIPEWIGYRILEYEGGLDAN